MLRCRDLLESKIGYPTKDGRGRAEKTASGSGVTSAGCLTAASTRGLRPRVTISRNGRISVSEGGYHGPENRSRAFCRSHGSAQQATPSLRPCRGGLAAAAVRATLPAGRAFTIAFSREAGSGGITVAREVGRRLSWPVYDQELMENLAKELKVDVSFLEDYDERRGSFLVDTIKAFSASAGVTEVTYFRRLVQMLHVLGARGECLVVGRGSTFVLPLDTTLRVRIVATRDDRIAFIARERNVSPVEAARFVDTKDRDRQKFIKDHFHKDPADPQNYDLIINRSRFSIDETAEMVIEALQRMSGAEDRREERQGVAAESSRICRMSTDQ